MKASLLRKNNWFKLLTDPLRVGIILIGPEGKILEANPSGLALLGADRIAGVKSRGFQDFWDLVDEQRDDLSFEESPFATILQTQHGVYHHTIGVKKPRQILWLKINIDPLYDGEKNILGYLVSLVDITEQKNAEEKLLQAWAHAESQARLVSLGEMAGGIAHEINNPLTIIALKLDHLKAHIEEENGFDKMHALEVIETILTTTQRIASIVKSLRYFARDGAKDPFTTVTAQSILENTLALCQERFANHKIKLNVPECDETLSVECSQIQIHQVLLNLLNNAFDAVEKKKDKWITIDVQDKGSEVRFSVTDSGGGITPAIAIKVFQPFFTTKDIGKGTGLGLSISKGIMNRHHGRLEIDRTQKNTTFVMTLPKKQPKEHDEAA